MKVTDIILIFVAICVVLFAIFFIAPPISEKSDLQQELLKAQEQVEQLKAELREADSQIEKLRTKDKETIESVARDKFGLAKEGEVIYKVPRQEKGAE